MANQHRLGNWSTEDNNPVHDARSLRYMLGINAADNHASSVSSSPPRRLHGLNLNMIPTSGNGGWTHLSSIRERDNNSFSSSYPTIGGQTGVGPASPAAGNNISDVIPMLPFGGRVNPTTTTTTAAATTGRRWWNQSTLNEIVDVDGGGVNTNTTTTVVATTGRRWWNQTILNEVVDVGGDNTTTNIDVATATTGRRWWNQPILNDGGGVNTTTTTAAATTGRRWWNQTILNEVEDGGPTSFLASTTVPRRPGSFVPSPPPSSPSLSDYLINPHPPQSERYMQTDSTLASSETPARPGGNNNIFISTSEIRAETDRLMDEIQNTLQHLRNGGSIRSEDVMILDFLITINPLIDSDDWLNQIMTALEGHIRRVERGLTEEEILRNIHEDTYQFNPDETSTQNQTCTICQEDFVDGESIGRLECVHVYHLHCIKQWLELRNACPICKKTALEIVEDEDGN